MIKYLFLSIVSLLLVGGCTDHSILNTLSYDLGKGRSAHDDIPGRSAGFDQPHYVERDVTLQNPNFLDLKGTSTGNERGSHIGIDVDKARKVVGRTKGYRPGSVYTEGSSMWVTVYKKGIKNEQDRLKARAQMHKRLVQALPRYDIDVNVLDDKR